VAAETAALRGSVGAPPARRLSAVWRAAGRQSLAFGYAAFVLLPVAYMALIAFHSSATVGTGGILPQRWHWQTFTEMWETVDLGRYTKNSFVIAGVTGVASSVLGFGASYVVARFRFPLRGAFRTSLLATQTVPSVLLLLPLFVIYVVIQHALHVVIVGSYFGVVLTYMTFALPFSIWVLSVYIASLPVEVEEQALVDGANRLGVLRWVTLPLSLPGLVVAFVFSFLLAWNDVLFASVLTTPATRTLGIGLQYYLAENYSFPEWNQLMGASIVSALPAVALFLLVQRYIVTGLTGGSLKD
jgi:ABC-type glycerol-3-phosphate transport system permease component